MEKIAWIIDSTAGNFEQDYADKHHIYTLPIQVIVGENSYKEGVDLTPSEFFEQLATSKENITTSQPSLGSTIALFEQLKEKGYEKFIAVHVSSAVSGTYSSTITASKLVGIDLVAIDSKISSFPIKVMIQTGIDLLHNHHTTEEIIFNLRKMADQTNAYLVVGNLERLYKSGRMNGMQALMGQFLQIKPILTIKDGNIVPKENVRTFKKAQNRMIDLFQEVLTAHPGQSLEAGIAHTASPKEAEQFRVELSNRFPDITFNVCELSVALGVHTGKGTLAIFWIFK